MAMTPEQNQSIAAFWDANKDNPQAVMDAMTQYGVGAADLANAIGRNVSEVGNYLVDNGAARGFGGFSKGITDTYYGSAIDPSQYQQALVAAAANPTVVAGPTTPGQTALDGIRDPNPRPVYQPAAYQPPSTGSYQPPTNVVQPGTSPGWGSGAPGLPQSYPQQPQVPQYQMPVLNALYQAQQQRMTAPVPRFNFQQQGPLTATANPQQSTIMAGETPPGALTTAISGT